MGLTEYPEPEIRELEPDDAPSIYWILPNHRGFRADGIYASFGTAQAGVEYFREFGAAGGYTHLKHNK